MVKAERLVVKFVSSLNDLTNTFRKKVETSLTPQKILERFKSSKDELLGSYPDTFC